GRRRGPPARVLALVVAVGFAGQIDLASGPCDRPLRIVEDLFDSGIAVLPVEARPGGPVGPRTGAVGAAGLRAALALALALREVAQKLACDGGRLSRHAVARAPHHLLGLRRMRERGGEQGCRQTSIVLAGRLDEPARVASVRRPGGVHQQAEQALALRPARARVLLVAHPRVRADP